MPEVYTIPLSKIIHELQLETAFLPKSADDILIQSRDVVRPGMELNGYHEYFDPNRIAVLGRAEMYMLESLKPERRAMALDSYLSLKPPAVIVARGIDPGKDFMEIAETYHVPVLRTTESTSNVVASLVAYLNVELAPRITRHGVLVEVYGEGILLVGDSGVGKSETAIELIKRGHRLVADDAVEIRRIGDTLTGTAPELIRHYLEVRGIGVVDIQKLFGMSGVKSATQIDLVIQFERWQDEKFYDRLGLDEAHTQIMGVPIPLLTIPVSAGRNLAGIVELAVMNNRQKKYGINSAREFVEQIDSHIDHQAAQEKNR